MPDPFADCGGEEHAGSASCDGNAGCNGCAANGRVGACVSCSLGAGGTVCGEGGGSGGGGDKAVGSGGLGSTVSGDCVVVPALCVLPVLCGAGWSGGACGI